MGKGIPTICEIGAKFRKLTVLSLVKQTSFGNYYLCKCDCGGEITLTGGQLENRVGSCGCRNRPHRVSETYRRLQSVWRGMIRRCYDVKHKAYNSYGGRGILVCDEWLKFDNFYEDMADSYVKGLQLDREKNNEWYCKSNCRWVTAKVNMRNRRDVKLTEADVLIIRASNKTTVELGIFYNIDHGQISKIKNNKAWVL